MKFTDLDELIDDMRAIEPDNFWDDPEDIIRHDEWSHCMEILLDVRKTEQDPYVLSVLNNLSNAVCGFVAMTETAEEFKDELKTKL